MLKTLFLNPPSFEGFDGGHFYLKPHIDAVAELLASSARCEQTA